MASFRRGTGRLLEICKPFKSDTRSIAFIRNRTPLNKVFVSCSVAVSAVVFYYFTAKFRKSHTVYAFKPKKVSSVVNKI